MMMIVDLDDNGSGCGCSFGCGIDVDDCNGGGNDCGGIDDDTDC